MNVSTFLKTIATLSNQTARANKRILQKEPFPFFLPKDDKIEQWNGRTTSEIQVKVSTFPGPHLNIMHF